MYARTCYNMDMKLKKTIALFLGAATAITALSGAYTLLPARADGGFERADELVELNRDNAFLHLPDSYEQYLPLDNPTYVAMNEEHIAIADNSTIYVYDKAEKVYTRYDHEPLNQPTEVTKIQFSDEGEMFFRDAGGQLWHYNFETHECDKDPLRDISCQTFLIHGEFLYFVSETNQGPSYFYYVPISDPQFSNRTELAKYSAASNPRMAYAGDTLYCIINNNTIDAYSYDAATQTHNFVGGNKKLNSAYHEVTNLQFVCAYGDELFYTVKGEKNENNGLWRTDFEGNAERLLKGDDYSTITTYGDKLYCIQGNTIRELEVDETSVQPTGYEISITSSSPHRLSNAGETVRTKELVVIADSGNRRISVYDRLDGSYYLIPCEDGSNTFVPEHIAVSKEEVEVKKGGTDFVTINKIVVSNGTKIYEYTFERHTLETEKEENGAHGPTLYTALQPVKGLTYVYGECYYITEFDGYGSLSNPTAGELHFSGIKSPEVITSDIYGTIYVAFGNKVYSFSEEDFLKDGASGNAVISLSANSEKVYQSLNVDYEGNVWHLAKDGYLYCNNTAVSKIDGGDFVYLNKEHDYPVSFALCFEDDQIYFNFANYVVCSKAYAMDALPSLNKISAGEAKTKAFALADPEKLFVTVPAGSVGFEIALDELKSSESTHFPYESYFRLEDKTQERLGVLLYDPQDENDYYVVALYNEELHTFTANLFKKSKNKLQLAQNCYTEADGYAYITSDVSLCSAPCLFPAPKGELSALSIERLERGTKLKVLGYAEGEGKPYAFVEVADNTREIKRGYVPRSYLTGSDPNGVKGEDYFLGYLKADAGIKLVSADGKILEITKKTQAKLYKNEDGTYTAVVVQDGVTYTGIVNSEAVARGETDALRISLIVILSVLALVIIAGYVILMFPRKKKKD